MIHPCPHHPTRHFTCWTYRLVFSSSWISPTTSVGLDITSAQTLDRLNISLLPTPHDMMEGYDGVARPTNGAQGNNSDEGWRPGRFWGKVCTPLTGPVLVEGLKRMWVVSLIISSHAHCALQRTFTDEARETQHLIHAERVVARCQHTKTSHAMAWVINSTLTLRAAYERSVWRNTRGLDSIPAVPFVRWLGLTNSSFELNLYTVGFFALALRGPSTSFPMFSVHIHILSRINSQYRLSSPAINVLRRAPILNLIYSGIVNYSEGCRAHDRNIRSHRLSFIRVRRDSHWWWNPGTLKKHLTRTRIRYRPYPGPRMYHYRGLT